MSPFRYPAFLRPPLMISQSSNNRNLIDITESTASQVSMVERKERERERERDRGENSGKFGGKSWKWMSLENYGISFTLSRHFFSVLFSVFSVLFYAVFSNLSNPFVNGLWLGPGFGLMRRSLSISRWAYSKEASTGMRRWAHIGVRQRIGLGMAHANGEPGWTMTKPISEVSRSIYGWSAFSLS